MTHCSTCGTPNPEDSRFCSECGETLPSAGTRCPMCDTSNEVGDIHCEKCGARLVPMSATSGERPSEEDTRSVEEISLPTVPLGEADAEQEKRPVDQTEHEDVPSGDWLDDLRDTTAGQLEGIEGDEQAEDAGENLEPAHIPDWLSDLGPISEARVRSSGGEAFPPDEAATPEDATPAGLTTGLADIVKPPSRPAPPDVDKPQPDADQAPEEEKAPVLPEIPDWLAELGPVSEEVPPATGERSTMPEPTGESAEADRPQAEVLAPEEMPSWMRDVAPREVADAPTGQDDAPDTEPAVIDIRDWLEDVEDGTPLSHEGSEPLGEPSAPEEAVGTEREAEPAASTELPAESVRVPSWLEEAEAGLATSPPDEPAPPFTEAPREEIETPDWLAELVAEEPTGEETAPPFAADLDAAADEWDEDLDRAQIPDWMQELKPRPDEGEEAFRGPLETEGLLKGLQGLILADGAIGAPAGLELPSTSGPSEASLARAELLQSLVGQPTAQPTVRPRRETREGTRDAPDQAVRWLVVGILIVTVLFALLARLVTDQGLQMTQPVTSSRAANLYRVVDRLGPGDHVLVAFDYGPPESDELDAAVRPVLKHVLERGAGVSIVSTRPDGPLIAQAMMSSVADSEEQYTFVGYRPGTSTAVSQLLAVADTEPTLLLVLTSRPLPLRLWIEQASARYGDRLPLVAVGSAAVEPVANPYLDTNAKQLRGAVHGLRGAAAYEKLRGTIGGATQRLDALAAGHAAIAVMVIVGAVIYALGGARGEQM